MRILSHNVYWFQGVPFETDQPGDPNRHVLAGLVKCYREIRADVLCIQELQSREAFQALQDALDLDGDYLEGGDLRQYGGGILYKEGVRVTDSSQSQVKSQRIWQISESRVDGAATKIANIPRPSSRQLGNEGAARKRLEEVDAVLGNDPHVVVGDWNERPGGALTDRMTEAGYLDAAALAGKADEPTSIGTNRGDQIWIAERIRDRFTGYGVLRKDDLDAEDISEKTYLSDHLPLWVDLEVGNASV